MLLESSSFRGLNTSERPQWMGSFSLQAPPNTDLWRKPPSRDTSTAPVLYTCLRSPFVAAEVTVSAEWELEWDQGGLVIFAGSPPGQALSHPAVTTPRSGGAAAADPPNTSRPRAPDPPPAYISPPPASKWVKAGLEFCSGVPHASSVSATSDGADWALAPLSAHAHQRLDLRVKLERVGYALWIWFEDTVMGWKKLREVTWFFWGVEDKAVRVGVYASRPANFGGVVGPRAGGAAAGMGTGSAGASGGAGTAHRAGLVVEFEGLEIF